MESLKVLRLILSGDSKGAVAALRAAEGQAATTSSRFGGLFSALKTGALVAAGGLAALLLEFKKAVSTFEQWGGSIKTITRLTGVSTEEASRFAGQWKAFGIDASKGITALKFLEKNIYAAEQAAGPARDAFKQLGIKMSTLKDLTPGNQIAYVRQQLSLLTDNGKRTALTLKLMGRGGTDMMKWVTASPAKISKLNGTLEQLGLVWGDKQIKSFEDLAAKQHEMELYMMAFQVKVAQSVVPIVLRLQSAFASLALAIQPYAGMLKWLAAGFGTYLGVFLLVIAAQKAYHTAMTIGAAATRIYAAAQWLLNAAMSANPIGLVVIAIAGLIAILIIAYKKVGWFRNGVNAAWGAIKKVTADVWGAVKSVVGSVIDWIWGKIQWVIDKIDAIKNAASSIVHFLGGSSTATGGKGITGRAVPRAEGGYIPPRPGGTTVLAAEAGEGEWFIPESKVSQFARAVLSGAGSKGAGQVIIPIHLDGQQIARYVLDLGDKQARITARTWGLRPV